MQQRYDSNRVYSEEIKGEYLIREFAENLTSMELVWHRDKMDRYVYPLHETDWMFQLDNDIPRLLNKEIFIPKETYHRLIKGTGSLKVKIKEVG